MAYNLKNRNFLKLLDFTPKEIKFLLKLSLDLKKAKYSGVERKVLKGKNIALIFEKASTRTRCAFEVAATEQGASVTYLGPSGTHIGYKETIKDTARVLGRMYDGIEYRGYGQNIIEEIAKYAGVPVWNGLTNEYHPTQVLADILTIIEDSDKPLPNVSLSYLGDARNNMGNSLMIGTAKMGMDFRIAAPKQYQPDELLVSQCRKIIKETGGKLTITDDPTDAVKKVDYISTDVWLSMGEKEDLWSKRIKDLLPFQVNKKLLESSNNPKVKFLHCLPSFHNKYTEIGNKIYNRFKLESLEVTEDVFESKASLVFDEAENRLHTIKAVMVATLGEY